VRLTVESTKTFSYDATSFPAAAVKYQYEIPSKENDFWNGNNEQNLDLQQWKLQENSIKWLHKNERVIYWIKKNNWSVLNIIDLKTHFEWIEIIVIQQKDLRDGGWKRERLWGMELGRWRKREGWKDWDMKWVRDEGERRSRPD
jgi:hypothetical protein